MAYKQENNPFKKIGDPPTGDVQATASDTIRVSHSDQATVRKKLQRKFNGIIPKGAKLTLKDGKYTYTVVKPKQ
tara:strand:+ start:695 stop:916 length:222 start_codon:yes stop_codon:yes gene_type:complete